MNSEVIHWLNQLSEETAHAEFLKCCGAPWWCDEMVASRPFADEAALLALVDAVFAKMPREAWLTAFGSHPKIGDLDSLRMKLAGNKQWSAGEQAGVDIADEKTLQRLAAGNHEYEERFGFVFIVCATGKTAAEMLALLETRLRNDDATELKTAGEEQRKITQLRLAKLLPTA